MYKVDGNGSAEYGREEFNRMEKELGPNLCVGTYRQSG